MKRILIAVLAVFVFLAACKNADKKTGDNKGVPDQTPQSIADSLYQQVIDEHNEGMSGWMKIESREKQIKTLLDSIAGMPSKTQSSLAPLKAKLQEATTELKTAYDEMSTWMENMNLDSAVDNAKVRIEYLTAEKLKGGKITEMINNSLQKADSLLKAKF